MQVYFFTAGLESSELSELEGRIRTQLPNLRKVAKLDEVTSRLSQNARLTTMNKAYIIFPVLAAESIRPHREHRGARNIPVSFSFSSAGRFRPAITSDWSAAEARTGYRCKALRRKFWTLFLVPAGRKSDPAAIEQVRPAIVAFVPSGGGVGNATLAIETAVQIKLDKQTRGRRVCLLDLDLQASHICDYLDIEPRLQIAGDHRKSRPAGRATVRSFCQPSRG